MLKVVDSEGYIFEIDADGFLKECCPDLKPRPQHEQHI